MRPDEATAGASLTDAPIAYIVDDLAEDRTDAARLAIAAGLRVELFEGGQAFLDALPDLTPGIVLLDVMMPCADGPKVLKRIVELDQAYVVVMMSARADISTAVGAMRSGAHDFLLKPLTDTEADATLKRAMKAATDKTEASDQKSQLHDIMQTITKKEMIVLRKLIAGKRNKNIAFEMGVSERTVEVHRSRLIRRAGADSFAGLITFAVKAGIEPDSE